MSSDTPISTADHGTIEAARELLNAELPDRRFIDTTYLEWLYKLNPYGDAIFGFRSDDDGQIVGHYALIPQQFVGPNGPFPFMFSLNAVSRSTSQRKGTFVSLTKELFARAEDAGYVGAIGVTNDNSTRAVKRTAFRYLGPMPVVVRPHLGAVRSRKGLTGWTSEPVSAAFLESQRFVDALDDTRPKPGRGIQNDWTPDYLRWRLSAPNSGPYVIHHNSEMVVVSTAHHVGPVPVAVVLKVLPRRSAIRSGPLDANSAMSVAAQWHKAPGSLYAGFNADALINGIHPPRSVLPAPLNLNYVPFGPRLPVTDLHVDTFEFLDCDAY